MIPVFHPRAQVTPRVEAMFGQVYLAQARSEDHRPGLPNMGYVQSAGRPRDPVAEEKRRLYRMGVSREDILARLGGTRQALNNVLRLPEVGGDPVAVKPAPKPKAPSKCERQRNADLRNFYHGGAPIEEIERRFKVGRDLILQIVGEA